MRNKPFFTGEEVAIMPSSTARPGEALEIARVLHVNDYIVQLDDGRIYALEDGQVVRATDEHRSAVNEAGKLSHRCLPVATVQRPRRDRYSRDAGQGRGTCNQGNG